LQASVTSLIVGNQLLFDGRPVAGCVTVVITSSGYRAKIAVIAAT
jgi:hypothetical protein